MLHDKRTKPESEWTYYVVDNVPRMSNIYRYDTLQEAIDKYKSLPNDAIKAIGSSIDGRHEIDHIHCRSGQNVLVMDCANLDPWKSSQESIDAIDMMIAQLNVQHQLSGMFGREYPSVVVELERYKDPNLENYFHNKLLRPADPKSLLSAINEVYVEGAGWLSMDVFMVRLYNSRPKAMGEGAESNFVTRLNIDYIDDHGRTGQADLSTKDFVRLKEKTEREITPVKLAGDLYAFAEDLDFYDAMDQADTKEKELLHIEKDIESGSVYAYTKFLTESLEEGLPSDAQHKEALSLLSRLTVLTPDQFRKPALVAMIRGAENKVRNAGPDTKKALESDMPR